MSWQEIANNQRKILNKVGEKLTALHPHTQGNQAMAEVYSGMRHAWETAMNAMSLFEADMQETENVPHGGAIPRKCQPQIEHLEPQKYRAAIEVWACARCLELPTDIYREEFRRQQTELIKKLAILVTDSQIPPEDLEQDLRSFSQILGSFGDFEVEQKKESGGLFSTLAKGIPFAALGGLGGYIAAKPSTISAIGRKLNPFSRKKEEDEEE